MKEDIKIITLEQIKEYIKSKYNYEIHIDNKELIVKHNKHILTIRICNTKEYSCFDDIKWISINYMYKLNGHGYGINVKDYTTDIIDEELKYFESED